MNVETISHYRILRKVGEGGMGVVYEAVDTRLRRPVALKLLKELKPSLRERLRREARAVAALNHPNICTIYDIDESENQPFLAMEWLDGQTLRELISEKPLSLRQLLRIATQVASALQAAHEKGIIHRDIKSLNVLITAEQAKVLDFGLAKFSFGAQTCAGKAHESADLTESLVSGGEGLIGTVAYMSPEQVKGEELDARSDLFSFGVLLYEMATGTLPFRGTTSEVISAILRDGPKAPSSLNLSVPNEFERIITKSLEKQRDHRYQTASDVLEDMTRLQTKMATEQQFGIPERKSDHPIPSIAVLPFANVSSDPENDFFGDGLAEELINALAKLSDLRVASRTSTFQFKAAGINVQEIGRRLDVNTVLEGSVRKAGNRLRISAQLYDVTHGRHLWSDRFDRQLEDVFAIQDEIAQTIVSALKVRLVGRKSQSLVKRYTENVGAYSSFLKGRFYWNKRTPDAFSKSIECLNQALEIDPSYALAHAGLASCYVNMGAYRLLHQKNAMPKARAEACTALDNDDSLAEAHSALGAVRAIYQHDWTEAECCFNRAMELDPNYATARIWYIWCVLLPMKRLDEAEEHAKRALASDPVSIVGCATVGLVYQAKRQFHKAIQIHRQALDLDPDHPLPIACIADAYLAVGQNDEALEAYRKARNSPVAVVGEAIACSLAGDHEGMKTVLSEQRAAVDQGDSSLAGPLAKTFALLDMPDLTLDYLEKAFDARDAGLLHLATDRCFDGLRSDLRFQSVMRHMGL